MGVNSWERYEEFEETIHQLLARQFSLSSRLRNRITQKCVSLITELTHPDSQELDNADSEEREMNKSVENLQENAVKWWPKEILATAESSSSIGLLKKTHSDFLSLLVNIPSDVEKVRDYLNSIPMSFNVFLKHLLILADFGGEKIQRIHLDRMELFESDKGFLFSLGGSEYFMTVEAFLSSKAVTNSKLQVDGKKIFSKSDTTDLQIDLALIVLFGNFSTKTALASALKSCDLFQFAGEEQKLRDYVSARYLEVSRIGSGADANALGQALQIEVDHRLKALLGDGYQIQQNGRINIEGRTVTSDLLVQHNGKSVAIEVAFQVTTNSTIERKATDAVQRKTDLNKHGIASCYMLDGIGIFERRAALSKILNQSDLVVNFSEIDTKRLAAFIKDWCR